MTRVFGTATGLAALAAMPVRADAPATDDAQVSRSQLEVARQIRGQATVIAAVAPHGLTPEDAKAPPFRKQNWTVSGTVTRCFKGKAVPKAVTYLITAEGRPEALARPHVAFLRRAGGQWFAVDGPMFRDSTPFRAGLAKITPGCAA
jgi:hypothetical protein